MLLSVICVLHSHDAVGLGAGKPISVAALLLIPGFLSAYSVPRPFRAVFLAEVLRLSFVYAVRNSVPSTHMRCMMTAGSLAKAILARFVPLRTATRIAHAYSGVLLVDRTSVTCPASCSATRTPASPAFVIEATRSVSTD